MINNGIYPYAKAFLYKTYCLPITTYSLEFKIDNSIIKYINKMQDNIERYIW